VWNDPEGNPPPEGVTIPLIPGATSDEWTDWIWYTTTIDNAPCREIIDNVVDMAHFFYVHYSFPTYFKNIFEGHTATQLMNGVDREDVRPPSKSGKAPVMNGSSSVASYHGPSFMIDELTYHYGDGDARSVLINCHYPIDTNSFVLQYGIIVERRPGIDRATADVMAQRMGDFIKLGFEQDVAIWRNKTRIDNPLLCEEDGPLYQLRRWYQQFYVDRADVTPEMTDRFEFEIDTTKPNEAWRREVEENLARRAAAQDQPV
jgi:3-ketosteroid 9alpha-monooxygenase subunit A